MFTGIITDMGRVVAVEDKTGLRRLTIATAYPAAGIALGASIACSGPCLTVVAVVPDGTGARFTVEASAETLARSTAGRWTVGHRLNLERALKIGDELGGHIVSGHVDGVARVAEVREVTAAETGWGATRRFLIDVPEDLAPFIASKGSVALDGTSLTSNAVEGNRFAIDLIPHTLAVTTWGETRAGDAVNLEIDVIARYAARLLKRSPQG